MTMAHVMFVPKKLIMFGSPSIDSLHVVALCCWSHALSVDEGIHVVTCLNKGPVSQVRSCVTTPMT